MTLEIASPAVIDSIVEGLELSLPASVVLDTVGVDTGTFTAWLNVGAARAAEGWHGTDDPCATCVAMWPEPCGLWCPYVTLRARVMRARAVGAENLIADVRTKAMSESGGSRVLLELARSLYPDRIYDPRSKRGREFAELRLFGGDPADVRGDAEELELAQLDANVARTQAQTDLMLAQREQVGRSGSYFDRLIVAVAGAVVGGGAADGDTPEVTQAELEDASPSAALDGDLE